MNSQLFDQGPTEAFPYEVESLAAEGAMGLVFRARDVDLDRQVAIKVLRDREKGAEVDEEIRQRFLQEARAAAVLTHPGVAVVHRIGTLSGSPYIVMEWLEGDTLFDLIQRDGAMALSRAAAHILELLDVLASAHSEGVVHRDVKPSNLVVLANGRLKVTDFGIARLQKGRELVKTQEGSVLATPRYASPEQLKGQEVDGRSDLFSAALVFYQLLTAEFPWEGESLPELYVSIFQTPPISVRQRIPDLPAPLEAWFIRALAIERQDRFANAEQMAGELRRIIEQPTGAAAAPATADELMRTTRDMPAPLTLFAEPSAKTTWDAVLALFRSWSAQELGSMEREDFLDKLLDKPIHARAFAGAAIFGAHCLLIEDGIVLAAVRWRDGVLDAEAELADKANVTLFAVPDGCAVGTITLLASGFGATQPRYRDLDSLTVNLSAFAGKLLDQGFAGTMHLQAEGRSAVILLLDGRAELAVLAGTWPEDPQSKGWRDWLGSASATACFYDRVTQPPPWWFRRGFPRLEVGVTVGAPGASRQISETHLSKVLNLDDISESQLFRLELSGSAHGSVPVSSAPMMRFARWMLSDLPQWLVEHDKAEAWKYLADWLLLVRRVRLHSELERPEGGQADDFDLVSEDEAGKVLHIAHRLGKVDPRGLHAFVDRVVAAKESRTKRGDVGGVFLISRSFDRATLDAYRSLLNKGLGNRLFGLDRSMGYEGFVRLSARRGFHMLLVEERPDGFRPRLVKL